jgi:hypothetical protein
MNKACHTRYMFLTILRTNVYLILFTALLFGATISVASAESVVWSKTEEVELLHNKKIKGGGGAIMQNPNFTIQYNARAVTDSGEVVCGGTVSEGTNVTYEFVPHVYTDIYWFAIGYGYDSPYGDWTVDASDPGGRCLEKDFYDTHKEDKGANLYAAFSVASPSKSITSPCGTSTNGESVTCALSGSGTQTAQFDFGGTIGHFYGSHLSEGKSCEYDGVMPVLLDKKKKSSGGKISASYTLGDTYTLNIPTQSISCPVTVTESAGSPPNAPSVIAGGACVVDSPLTFSIQSTDPDGDGIKYQIDWNADGSVDQTVPPSGYVPSGTQLFSDPIYYSTTGTKTIKVRTQDETLLTSGWTTLSFDCSAPDDGDSFGGDGDAGDLPPPPAGGGLDVDLTLRAVPSLVRIGETSQIHWDSTNTESCTVTGDNGDSWNGVLSDVGGETSSAINERTIYTLSCIDIDGFPATKNAYVNILPVWREK